MAWLLVGHLTASKEPSRGAIGDNGPALLRVVSQSPEKMIRVAIIGLGAVTHNIHLPAYAQLKGKVRVVGGCDPDRDARASIQKSGKLERVFDSPQEMIEQTGPDIVAICTPPSLHHEQTLMALKYGCHVFC